MSTISTARKSVAFPSPYVSPIVPALTWDADATLTTAAKTVETILSGDVDAYAKIRGNVTTKSGTPGARRDAVIASLVAGHQYVTAGSAVAELSATLYREITAALLTDAGIPAADIAAHLTIPDATLPDGRTVKGHACSESRVSQLVKVGRVYLAVGTPDGYTLTELRTAASTTGAKLLSAALDAEDKPAAVAAAVRAASAKRAEQVAKASAKRKADAAAAKKVKDDNVRQSQPLPGASTPAKTDDAPDTSPASVPADSANVGSDVARLVELSDQLAALVGVVKNYTKKDLGAARAKKIGDVMMTLDNVRNTLDDYCADILA